MTTTLILAGVALPFVISPGASFTITVTSAANGDRFSPVKVWAGTALGIATLGLVASLTGAGELVASSATARLVIGVVGGGVLVAFGAMVLRGSLRSAHSGEQPSARATPLVLWAFLALISNVKALTLYALVLPTVEAELAGPFLYLGFGAVHIAMLLVWLLIVGAAVTAVPGMGSSTARRGLGLLGGTCMLALGAQTILSAVR